MIIIIDHLIQIISNHIDNLFRFYIEKKYDAIGKQLVQKSQMYKDQFLGLDSQG